jgi:ferredoxin-type protein NapF
MAEPSACTFCGLCARACPEGIVTTGGLPAIEFHAACTFCGACAEACPEPVFDRGLPPFRHRVLLGEGCLPRLGVTCGSCADICPEAAIRLRPRLGGPPLPALDAAACTGCGACLAACPGDAILILPAEEPPRHG